jgi:hypothetical protein
LRQQRFTNQSLQTGEQLLLDEAGGRGTSEALEKEYLRLTALPVASNVRPAPVLAKALKLVQAKWKDGAEYSYACEQLKSIRQDLTVQHIRGDLAVKVRSSSQELVTHVHGSQASTRGAGLTPACSSMLRPPGSQHSSQQLYPAHASLPQAPQRFSELATWHLPHLHQAPPALTPCAASRHSLTHCTRCPQVYETHARIAIEVGDWPEFKRCLTMLKQLYSEGQLGNHEEFAAYGLMLAAQHGADLYSRELVQLPEVILAHPLVQHAMSVCWAFRAGQPRAFNSLYPTAQRMAGYLMDPMLDKVRAVGLRALLVAFYPTGLPLSYVASELGFDEDADAAQFLRTSGVVVEGSTGVVDTKASRAAVAGPPRPR